MNEGLLIWGIVLIAVAAFLLVLEVFIPSAGIIAVTSAVVAIAGIVCLFRYDTNWGLIGSLAVMVIGPILGGFMLKIWPSTPIGRRLIYGDQTEEDRQRLAETERAMQAERLALIGLEGKAITDLRPIGMAQIGDNRYEVLAESGWIKAGSPLRITHADGAQIKVRQT